MQGNIMNRCLALGLVISGTLSARPLPPQEEKLWPSAADARVPAKVLQVPGAPGKPSAESLVVDEQQLYQIKDQATEVGDGFAPSAKRPIDSCFTSPIAVEKIASTSSDAVMIDKDNYQQELDSLSGDPDLEALLQKKIRWTGAHQFDQRFGYLLIKQHLNVQEAPKSAAPFTLKATAKAYLQDHDPVAFSLVCGVYYIKQINREARFYSLISYRTEDADTQDFADDLEYYTYGSGVAYDMDSNFLDAVKRHKVKVDAMYSGLIADGNFTAPLIQSIEDLRKYKGQFFVQGQTRPRGSIESAEIAQWTEHPEVLNVLADLGWPTKTRNLNNFTSNAGLIYRLDQLLKQNYLNLNFLHNLRQDVEHLGELYQPRRAILDPISSQSPLQSMISTTEFLQRVPPALMETYEKSRDESSHIIEQCWWALQDSNFLEFSYRSLVKNGEQPCVPADQLRIWSGPEALVLSYSAAKFHLEEPPQPVNVATWTFDETAFPNLDVNSSTSAAGFTAKVTTNAQLSNDPINFVNGVSDVSFIREGNHVYVLRDAGLASQQNNLIVALTAPQAWTWTGLDVLTQSNLGNSTSEDLHIAVEFSLTPDFSNVQTFGSYDNSGQGATFLTSLAGSVALPAGKVYLRLRSQTFIPDISNYIAYDDLRLKGIVDVK